MGQKACGIIKTTVPISSPVNELIWGQYAVSRVHRVSFVVQCVYVSGDSRFVDSLVGGHVAVDAKV